MGTQQLPLCWNSHQTEILATFQRLLMEESLVDVTLACEGISLKAHKTILSACSPFFQDLFLENPCKHPIVIMKDVKYRDLKGIVDFMYHGGINVAPDQLSEFLKTAEALKVKGLSENSTILDLNKHLKAQEKSPQKVAGFQQSLPSCILSKDLVETSIREESALCEQQPNVLADLIIGSENDTCTMEEETNTFNVKSEPEPNDDTCCEEVLPEHTLSDDSLLSVHYDERFVPHMEITEVDQTLVLVPGCQQGIVTNETLLQVSDTSNSDAVLPLEHMSSAESLGIVISPDVIDNPEPVMHCTSFEHCNVTVHSSSNQDIKPITLLSYEEPSVCSTSNQLHQKYNSTDLKVKRATDISEQRIFISSEQEGKTPLSSLRGNQLTIVNSGDARAISRKEHQQNINFQRNFLEGNKMQSEEIPQKATNNDIEKDVCPANQYHNLFLVQDKTVQQLKHREVFLKHKNINNSENPFSCNRCNKTFPVIEKLQKHWLFHLGKKSHACDNCAKRFMTSTELKIHQRTHTGERPYHCDVCHYRFTTKWNLTSHKRIHTGEKPYCCPLCGKRFTHYSTLRKHKRTHL